MDEMTTYHLKGVTHSNRITTRRQFHQTNFKLLIDSLINQFIVSALIFCIVYFKFYYYGYTTTVTSVCYVHAATIAYLSILEEGSLPYYSEFFFFFQFSLIQI